MACSCSCFCQAIITIAVSVVLAIGAISSATHLSGRTANGKPSLPFPSRTDPTLRHRFATNASRALRLSGFSATAALLQDLLLAATTDSTLFAIHDSGFNATVLPTWLLRDLLRYHTSPSRLPMSALLHRPAGSCLPTLLPGKNMVVTGVDPDKRTLEINGVPVSQPAILDYGPLIVHGVPSPFRSFDRDQFRLIKGFIPSPTCRPTASLQNRVPWRRIQKLLSSNGYISFAVSLGAVLDAILTDHANLTAVTVFAPAEAGFAYAASPSTLLERIVRLHILPQRMPYGDLAAVAVGGMLRTLAPGADLRVIASGTNQSQLLTINGVEVVEPDMVSATGFVVHGISRAFRTVGPSYCAFGV